MKKRIVEEKEIDEVNFSGSKKPYASKGVYYIRIADEDRVLQPHELRQLFEYNKNISWDAELTDYTVNDIDVKSLETFYKKATACGRLKEEEFDVSRILVKLGLMKKDRLTNAAYYLFSKNDPIVLKMAIFATDEKLTFLDINRVSGNIINLIDIANDYIKKNIRWKADIIEMKRVETPEVPLKALREIICNSFAHARYNSSTEHEITIHPSKIKIYNPGEFPIGYKPEDFIVDNLESIVRNPLILKTLFLSDDVETYGSGFRRVYDECKINDVITEYVLSREGFSFIFIRSVVNGVVNDVANKEMSKDEQLVLRLLKENPNLTASKIAELINKNSRTIKRITNELKNKK